jgi:hypothetical protein
MESGRIELTTDAVPTEPAYKLLEAAERVLWMRVDVRNIYNRLDVFNNTAKGDQTVQFASGLHATLGAAIREAYASQPKRTIGKYLITQCLTRTQRLAGIIS